jgi:hypothetical protein
MRHQVAVRWARVRFCGWVQGIYNTKLDWKAGSEDETWCTYEDNCITQLLVSPEDPPRRVASPNTRITRAIDEKMVNWPTRHEKEARLPRLDVGTDRTRTTHRTSHMTRATERSNDIPLSYPRSYTACSAALCLRSPALTCRFAIAGIEMETGRRTIACCRRCERSRQQSREVGRPSHEDCKAQSRSGVLLGHDGVMPQN